MELVNAIKTIISGGQTGVDRAAFDFALEKGIEIAGFVPRGRRAEDGIIPARYRNLTETESPDPAARTRLNVENSDATLIISRGPLSGGSELTRRFARSVGKPHLHIDLESVTTDEALNAARSWIEAVGCSKLNIAGPRGSEDATIYNATLNFLRAI